MSTEKWIVLAWKVEIDKYFFFTHKVCSHCCWFFFVVIFLFYSEHVLCTYRWIEAKCSSVIEQKRKGLIPLLPIEKFLSGFPWIANKKLQKYLMIMVNQETRMYHYMSYRVRFKKSLWSPFTLLLSYDLGNSSRVYKIDKNLDVRRDHELFKNYLN